jgi:hypothetical protein
MSHDEPGANDNVTTLTPGGSTPIMQLLRQAVCQDARDWLKAEIENTSAVLDR